MLTLFKDHSKTLIYSSSFPPFFPPSPPHSFSSLFSQFLLPSQPAVSLSPFFSPSISFDIDPLRTFLQCLCNCKDADVWLGFQIRYCHPCTIKRQHHSRKQKNHFFKHRTHLLFQKVKWKYLSASKIGTKVRDTSSLWIQSKCRKKHDSSYFFFLRIRHLFCQLHTLQKFQWVP